MGIPFNGNVTGLMNGDPTPTSPVCEMSSSSPMKEDVVHLQHLGSPACGLKGQPWEWPEGHTVVYPADYQSVNCAGCATFWMNKMQEGKSPVW